MEPSSPTPELPREAEPQLRCKICGGDALLFGTVDFNRNSNEAAGIVLPPTGVPIHYHRCRGCGFLFTTAFDHFTPDDFARYIYNDQYLLVDPDYVERRPRHFAQGFAGAFPDLRGQRLLDYGAGSGKMAQLLRADGFGHVDVYDPFVAAHAQRPQGKYACVVAAEVAEHCTDPRSVFAEWASLRADGGAILLTTLLQPTDILDQGMNWWYIGPRNGHVSLYSRESLGALVRSLGLGGTSYDDTLHLLYLERPSFAARLQGGETLA